MYRYEYRLNRHVCLLRRLASRLPRARPRARKPSLPVKPSRRAPPRRCFRPSPPRARRRHLPRCHAPSGHGCATSRLLVHAAPPGAAPLPVAGHAPQFTVLPPPSRHGSPAASSPARGAPLLLPPCSGSSSPRAPSRPPPPSGRPRRCPAPLPWSRAHLALVLRPAREHLAAPRARARCHLPLPTGSRLTPRTTRKAPPAPTSPWAALSGPPTLSLVDSPACRYALQARLRLIRDCALAYPAFHPACLPAFSSSPPDDDDGDVLTDNAAAAARARPLRVVLPLLAYLDLPATRYRCAQRTFAAVLHHSERDTVLLTSVSQRGAHDFHNAPLSDSRSHVLSINFRLALLYHLGLPIPGLHASDDDLGDHAISTFQHTSRHSGHTDVLNAWYHALLAAHSVAGAIREPMDHASYSPGKRPDFYLPALHLALDIKTASIFTARTSRAAAHTAVAANAERFLLRAFGDPRSGSSGEYSAALRRGTSVTLLITEVTGARHPHCDRLLRSCAAVYAETHPSLDGPPASLPFYALHSSLPSMASLRGLGRQLRTRVLSSVSAASLRRRAPTLPPPCGPARPGP